MLKTDYCHRLLVHYPSYESCEEVTLMITSCDTNQSQVLGVRELLLLFLAPDMITFFQREMVGAPRNVHYMNFHRIGRWING